MYPGVKSNKRVASAKGSKLRPLKKLPNRVKFEDNSEIIEEIMDISPKATKPLALSPVSNGIILLLIFFVSALVL